jgi:hypothetical protein
MEQGAPDTIKQREISFNPLHPDASQARSAMLLLSGVVGVVDMRLLDDSRLYISYDIRIITLKLIEDALVEVGFHLQNTLLVKLKRALYHYTEEVQQDNMGCPKGDPNCTQRVFVNRYQKLPHGCRDERPEHWRKYL